MKCWQGNLDGRSMGLVAATSQRAAIDVIGTSMSDFRNHWSRCPLPTWPDFKPFTLYVRKYDSSESWQPRRRNDDD